MSYYLAPIFNGQIQFTQNDGSPLANGLIYTYQGGTTNAYSTWTSNTGAANNPNPIVLDSTGRLTNEIWIQGGVPMKFVLTDSTNVAIGITYDNVSGVNDLTQYVSNVNVINSVTSTDTSNAASANSAKWAYNEAVLAYIQANAAYAAANAAQTAAASSQSGKVLGNGTLVYSQGNTNFVNSSTMNVTVTANGSGYANVSISPNTANNSLANTTGYAYLPGGLIMQYGTVTGSSGTGTPVTFPITFPTALIGVNLTNKGLYGGTIAVYNQSTSGFSCIIESSAYGDTTFWQAWGY